MTSPNGHCCGHVTHSNFYSPLPKISGTATARDFKFCTLVRHVTVHHWDYKLSLKWVWSCDIFKFWEISDSILETVHDRDTVTVED